MNAKSKYEINMNVLNGYITTAQKNITVFKDRVNEQIEVDPCNKKEVLKKLHEEGYNIEKYSNITLKELEQDTLIYSLTQYNHNVDKLIKFNSLKQMVREEITGRMNETSFFISPEFKLNINAGLSLRKPALPFNQEEVSKLFRRLDNYIQFNSLEEITEFIRKYKQIIFEFQYDEWNKNYSRFCIIGTTLYFVNAYEHRDPFFGYYEEDEMLACNLYDIINMQRNSSSVYTTDDKEEGI